MNENPTCICSGRKPLCGHCKRLHPLWEKLAEIMNVKDDPQLIIAKVDCTKHQELCAEHEITGYPTLRFFKIGKEGSVKFKDTRDMPTITEFINEQLNNDNNISQDEGNGEVAKVTVKGKVVELSEENFAKHVSRGKHFVKFYALCENLHTTWEQLAKSLEDNETVSIAKIDCTTYLRICLDFEAADYPTLLWIEDGKKIEEYLSTRNLTELSSYVKKMLGSSVSPESSSNKTEASGEPDKSQVLQLTGESFEKSISNGITFVKFYAPWCSHCQELSPIRDQLAQKIHDSNKDIKIAKVDCTSPDNKRLCADQQVESYPTLLVYNNGERQSEYHESRSLSKLVNYITKFVYHDEL